MNIEQLYELASAGEQRRNVELKRSMSWDEPDTRAKIVKAILGMSNIRDNGFLILGFEQQGESFEPVGMSDDNINKYEYDKVSTEVARFADPYARFSI